MFMMSLRAALIGTGISQHEADVSEAEFMLSTSNTYVR